MNPSSWRGPPRKAGGQETEAFRSARRSWRAGELSPVPRGAGRGLCPEGNREPLQVWEQDKGVTGGAWSFGWRELGN